MSGYFARYRLEWWDSQRRPRGIWVDTEQTFFLERNACRALGERVADLKYAARWRVTEIRGGHVVMECERVKKHRRPPVASTGDRHA